MKNAAYIGGLLGLALLVTLVVRADFSAMLHTLNSGGWRLLWLVPYRSLFFFLYAAGWLILLRPYDPTHRARLGYAFWATTLRDARDRLLPVASVGGGGVRVPFVRWPRRAAETIGAPLIVA